MPSATTPSRAGEKNPQIGKQALTNRHDPTTPQAVIVGITFGQYTSQKAGDDADTLCLSDIGNLYGR